MQAGGGRVARQMEQSLSELLSAFQAERAEWRNRLLDLEAKVHEVADVLTHANFEDIQDQAALLKISTLDLLQKLAVLESEIAGLSQSMQTLCNFVRPDTVGGHLRKVGGPFWKAIKNREERRVDALLRLPLAKAYYNL